jgi:hypothetical protein
LEPGIDIWHGPDPLLRELVDEGGAIGPGNTFLQIHSVVGIWHPITSPERVQKLLQGRHRADSKLRNGRHAEQALGFDEDRRVPIRQTKSSLVDWRLRVVAGEVSCGRLLLQPLSRVALIRPGTRRQLRSGCRPLMVQHPVEVESIADIDTGDFQCIGDRRGNPAGKLIRYGVGHL